MKEFTVILDVNESFANRIVEFRRKYKIISSNHQKALTRVLRKYIHPYYETKNIVRIVGIIN